MEKVKLSTKGCGKKARREIAAILPHAKTISRLRVSGTYLIKNAEGKIIAHVEESYTPWAPTLNRGDKAILTIREN